MEIKVDIKKLNETNKQVIFRTVFKCLTELQEELHNDDVLTMNKLMALIIMKSGGEINKEYDNSAVMIPVQVMRKIIKKYIGSAELYFPTVVATLVDKEKADKVRMDIHNELCELIIT